MGSGLGSTIVKPCGLSSGEAGMHGLGVSHNGDLPSPGTFLVARADVARVMREAVIERSAGDVSETFPIESPGKQRCGFLPVACPRRFREAPTLQRLVGALWHPRQSTKPPWPRHRWHDRFSSFPFLLMQACASAFATTPAPRCLPTCPSCCRRRAGRGRRGDVSEVRRRSHLTSCLPWCREVFQKGFSTSATEKCLGSGRGRKCSVDMTEALRNCSSRVRWPLGREAVFARAFTLTLYSAPILEIIRR